MQPGTTSAADPNTLRQPVRPAQPGSGPLSPPRPGAFPRETRRPGLTLGKDADLDGEDDDLIDLDNLDDEDDEDDELEYVDFDDV